MKKIFMPASVVALAISFTAASASGLQSTTGKRSYAMGFETGKAMREHNISIDQSAYALGMKEGLNGQPRAMSEAQIKATLIAFQKDSMQKFKQKFDHQAQKNLMDGEKFLSANKLKKGVVTTASGLQYQILVRGKGQKPVASDKVTVDYEGTLINGHVFDSSYQRGKKATFPVAAVIKGWQQALTMMPVGSTWKIFVPAKLAYGKMGAPGAIGPNETLIFKVHLYSIQK